jgi:hypothetical protein
MLAGLANRRGAVLASMAWLLLGAGLGTLLAASSTTRWTAALLFAMPLTLVYGSAIGFSAYYLCRAYPLAARSPTLIVLVFMLAAACAGTLWAAAGMAWRELWMAFAPGMMELDANRRQLGAAMAGLGVLLYGAAAVLHYLGIEYASGRQAERRELELALQARDAELRMLRTQIDPHFLFNSLNSISALTAFDPGGARAMTLRLADFFRHSLGLEARRKVTLAEELTLVCHFVAIEQIRFGARLLFEQDADAAAAACLLPPMLLQPLVENAVKHGIGGLPEGGVVRVSAERKGAMLHLVVDNDADPDRSVQRRAGHGLGLANVRARLATDYGHLASIHWRQDGATFRVELTLPAETMETPCA